MELDDLKQLWEDKSKIDNADEWSRQMQQQLLAVDDTIKERNLYGTLTFLVVLLAMAAFEYFLFVMDSPVIALAGIATWMVTIAVALVRLHRVQRRDDIAMDQRINDALEEEIMLLRNESSFYSSIVITFFVPLGLGVVMVVIGVDASVIEMLYALGGYLVCCYIGSEYNKRHIATKLQPLVEELESCARDT